MIVNEEDVAALIKRDKVIHKVYQEIGTPPSWRQEEGFITLSNIILGQQVSLAAAEAHFQKLKNYIGDFLPQNILALTDEEMRSCFISRQKAKYLKDLSRAIISKTLRFEELKRLKPEEVKEKLTAIKGIGDWTANIYLMFCLQFKDVFPIKDIAVVHTIEELYNVAGRDAISGIAVQWKPLRSLGTYFMWHYYLTKRGRSSIL